MRGCPRAAAIEVSRRASAVFGMPPHANTRVVSYVFEGELTHRGSVGSVGMCPRESCSGSSLSLPTTSSH